MERAGAHKYFEYEDELISAFFNEPPIKSTTILTVAIFGIRSDGSKTRVD